MFVYRLNTKISITMLCLSGFELYSRWVPLPRGNGCVKNHKRVFVKAAMGFGYLIINLAALPVGLSAGGVSSFRFDVEYNFQPSESSIFIWPNLFVYVDVPLWWSLFQMFCFFMYSHLVCNNQRTWTIPTLICLF